MQVIAGTKRVQVTVVVDDGHGHTRIESATLAIGERQIGVDRIIADAARQAGRKAWFGDLVPPTPRSEGGRG